LQNPNQTNGDSLNSVRHETSRTFQEQKECLKEKLISLKQTVRTEIIIDLCRSIDEFKKGYQP